jgi:flagellar hook protein FlgE
MDVTANNISNVNTIAFKAGRATFKESMVQMLQGPSRPAGNQGGRNPLQVGLGVAVGSIDTLLRQGNLQTTGQITDIALEGRAYLAFSNGSGTYYSRNGGLQLDDKGRLCSPTNGFRLQGKMAQPDGSFTGGEIIGDIRIPWGEKSPAKATTNMTFGCNLNSDSEALGTVTHTNRFLASAAVLHDDSSATDNDGNMYDGPNGYSRGKLTDLYDEYGNSLGIREGDTISISTGDNGVPMFSFQVEKYQLMRGTPPQAVLDTNGEPVMQIPTLQDFMFHLEAYLNAINDEPLVSNAPTMQAKKEALDAYMRTYESDPSNLGSGAITLEIDRKTGGLSVNNQGNSAIKGLQVTSSRPGSKAYVANTFLFPSTIDFEGSGHYRTVVDPNNRGTLSPASVTAGVLWDAATSKYYVNNPAGAPAAPTDGQAYRDLVYSTANNRWEWNPNSGLTATSVPPAIVTFTAGNDPTFLDPYVPYSTPPIRIPASAANLNAVDPNNPTAAESTTRDNYNDVIGGLYDAVGRPLGFTNGDTVTINGQVGGKNKNLTFTYAETRDASGNLISGMRMQELLDFLQDALTLPSNDGTVYKRPSVAMKNSSDLVSDGIPAGSIVLRGQQEVAFALTGLSVIGKQADPNQPSSPTRFNTNMVFTEVQAARNTGTWETAHIIYDESGAEHQVVMKFTHTGTPGEWLWELMLKGGEEVILGGNMGKLTFALDGSPSSFTFDDGTNQFRFDPRNGASEVNVKMDIGGPGSFLGITQFESETTTAIKGQDGYPMGKLTEISIGEDGEISGMYSNGISKAIARIYVAEFNNPAGLLKMGDSMFGVSNNSGEAAMYQPGVGSTTKVKPGAIEMSNVELETEFTNMITLQRGYQASARVITTSDQMLQELVQLVR